MDYMKNKKRGQRRAKTKSVVTRRLKMVKCIYGKDEGYYTSKPGRLRKNNTSCNCWMCKAGRKTRRPDDAK